MKISAYISCFILLIFTACVGEGTREQPIFKLLNATETGIDFVNVIEESDSFNMYTFMNIYTGGGVAVGDINNDGLEDVFFSGNRVSSRLYLNQGELKFKDITQTAGLTTDRWCAGVAMVDINQDGWLDIYISVTGVGTPTQTSNLLYLNQGDETFKEVAQDYGLADARQMMQASFFDYDRDGDLDMYGLINPVDYSLANVNRIKERSLNGENKSTDCLYRNNGDNTFTDVSAEAGILVEGYGLGLSTCDINSDGWPDIYVSNDFLTNDIFYRNNGDGTFTNRASESLDHTSFAGMGNDVSDFNNDGWPDIMVADMLPEDNLRRKSIIPASSYDKFQLTLQMGYEPQYTRNTLQLNNGNGTFSEIGQLAGVDQTDWSWSSLFADYDNDGDKDLFVTNGFLRDVGNLDYINYQRTSNTPFGKQEEWHKQRLKAIQDLGAAKIQNYVFENKGDLSFIKKNTTWGIPQKTCSNGAAFADLDQDGDLEMIINNVNDVAFIYENTSNEKADHHFLKIQLQGAPQNRQGIGAKIRLTTQKGLQYYEHNLYRGYESTVSQVIHFGLGNQTLVDSLEITWPDGQTALLTAISVDKTIELLHQNAKPEKREMPIAKPALFAEISDLLGLKYLHQEEDYIDFKVQPLLPHKHSQNGPGIAVGDINGDGLEDCYIGGSGNFAGQFFLQNKLGQFEPSPMKLDSTYEDMGSLFFDADNDGDLDLYIVSGGSSFPANQAEYQDRFYQNDGQGNFTRLGQALPRMYDSGSCVTAADYDRDGDLDLFIGGRVVPGVYPQPARSHLLRNDSKGGKCRFTEVTEDIAVGLAEIGLVTSALWTDYDQDGWLDLLVTGEWMPIQFYKNNQGKLEATKPSGLAASNGWWNSLVAGDFDRDGDLDYLAGNRGWNSRYKTSPEEPLCIYASDYDQNGRVDPILCYYNEGENYIAHPRDQLIAQINAMRVRFKTYLDYASVPFSQSFTKEEIAGARIVKSETFATSYIENLGNGDFALRALPVEAQFAPVYGMQVEDYDQNGTLDVLLVGNSFSTETSLGAYDAFSGLLLSGDGQGGFIPQKIQQTGFHVETDAKAMARLSGVEGGAIYLVSSNADQLKVFQTNKNKNEIIIPLEREDCWAIIERADGQKHKKECYYGSGYLSQSSRQLNVDKTIKSLELINAKGEARKVDLSLFLQ